MPSLDWSAPAGWSSAAALACGVSVVSWWRGTLSVSGGVAASAIGIAAARNSWAMASYLIGWFALAALLSRWGREAKERRTGSVVSKNGRRDAWQVMANGGVFGACAAAGALPGLLPDLLPAVPPRTPPFADLTLFAVAALAAAGADTWGTEIGSWLGGAPRDIRSGAPVPPGTSGAVSRVGIAATAIGAVTLAALAAAVAAIPWHHAPLVAAAAFAGAALDTVLGATLQERRCCPACDERTEQRVHRCGTPTRHVAGLRGLDNDAVNLMATLGGGTTAVVARAVAVPW